MAENNLWTSQAPHAVEHAQHGNADVGEDREPDRGKAEGAEDEDNKLHGEREDDIFINDAECFAGDGNGLPDLP